MAVAVNETELPLRSSEPVRGTEKQTGLLIILCWVEGMGCGSSDFSLRPRSGSLRKEGSSQSLVHE